MELFKEKMLPALGLVLDVGLARLSSNDYLESTFVDFRVCILNADTLRGRPGEILELLERIRTYERLDLGRKSG